MQGQPERAMRAGVLVCFRMETTMELLWKARMSLLPREDDIVTRIVGDVETVYKVEEVRFEFFHRNVAEVVGYVDGVAQYGEYVPATIASTGPVVIVSAV
jgi:hypothetical protein